MKTKVESPNGLERQQASEEAKENMFSEAVNSVRNALQRNLDKMSPYNREFILALLNS